MVTNEIWALAGMQSGFLCIGCLEARIGRRLNPEDFPHLPINDPNDPWNTSRLASRLLGSERKETALSEAPEAAINSAYSVSGSVRDTKFDVREMVHGAVAVEVFADIHAGACICSTVRLGDAPEHPGKKMVSVSFSPLQPLTRFATHACNIAPHAAFFLMRHDRPCFAEFFDYLRYEDPYLFDVDLCGNDAEFRRAARLALDVMSKNRDLWYTKADDALDLLGAAFGVRP